MPENLQIIVCQPVSTFADNGDHVAERKIVLWLSFELENIKMPNGFPWHNKQLVRNEFMHSKFDFHRFSFYL